jgi:hypothetical protein
MADSKPITIDELTISVRRVKRALELFSIPVPTHMQEFYSKYPKRVRVLDNPLEDSLRNYIAWGKY